ncbi:MAG: phenylalanine--tRNA ligase subunit alpha [Defluviitaleaceae bacterium]|nr:phenylalanine--tRNA ligase subunit alpha [Defluviitaleaceae bacterium]
MTGKIAELKQRCSQRVLQCTCLKDLEQLRLEILGKKGELTQLLKSLGSAPAEERPILGQLVNSAREEIEAELEASKADIVRQERTERMAAEKIDVTLPGKAPALGAKHPITNVLDTLKSIFIGMGYSIAEGPEIETPYYNFDALNMPPAHPARSEQDTFYFADGNSLRTSTSPMQVHIMEQGKLPIKAICPGRVFRRDEVDATHAPVFHQLEGIVVDRDVTMGDLKGTLAMFAQELFGAETKVRFRPHYFPFTEPSAEMDVSCFACGGVGCRVCKHEGFIEILGCGMIHPRVLKMSGIDPDVYSGFAFGMGLERITMQKYGVMDLRLFYENDVRFLKQF